MKIFTMGYEGCDIQEFVDFLHRKKIQEVVDVRKNPISRKRGFSKSKLAESLAARKIDYLHLVNLGVPSAWRKQAKAKVITRKKMFADYVKKILPRDQEEITELLQLAKKKRLALLCYEADAEDCHRHFVALEMKKKAAGKLQIVDLHFAPSTSRKRSRAK
jgi:uncharacterized protein (DUF488 family)